MARWTALVAALVALCIGVAACGGGGDDSAEGPKTADPKKVEGTVRVIMEEVPDTDVVEQLLPAFKQEYPNVDVKIEALPYDQMRDRVVSSFLAADPSYDLIIVDNPWMRDFVDSKFLTPLDDVIKKTEGYDYEDFSKPLRDIAEVDGKTYGVPFYNYALALIYRKDLYKQAGLTPPKTLDELEAAAAKLNTDGRAGIAMQPQTGYKIFEEWGNYLFAAGGSIQDADGNLTLDSPEAREALQKYIDIYKGYAPKNSLNWAFDEAQRAVASDKAPQLISYNWTLPSLNKTKGLENKFGFAEVPGGKAVLGAWYWAIPANSGNPDAAWAFASWITAKENDKQRVILGGAPVRNSVMDDAEVWTRGFGANYYKTIKDILVDAAPLGDGPNAEEMVTQIGDELNAAVSGQKSVDQAITDATKRAQEALDKSN